MNVIVTSKLDREYDLGALEQVARFALDQEQAPEASEVSITLVDNSEIANLNKEYRDKKGPTDVLSFECDSAEDEPLVDDLGDSVLMLGDIVIAPDVACVQAVEYGVTLEQELDLLVIHGVLHLLGYDHIEDDDARIMETREDKLLKAWWAKL